MIPRPITGQLEHPPPQGGEHTIARGLSGRVELVEVVAHLFQWRHVTVPDGGLVTDPQPEQKAALVLLVEPDCYGGHVAGFLAPYVDDAGSDHQRRRAAESRLAPVEHVAAEAAGDPQGPVPERFDLGSEVGNGGGIDGMGLTRPDPDAAEFHGRSPYSVAQRLIGARSTRGRRGLSIRLFCRARLFARAGLLIVPAPAGRATMVRLW